MSIKEMMRGVDLAFQFEIALHRYPAQSCLTVLGGVDRKLKAQRVKSEPDLNGVAVNLVDFGQ